MAENYYQQINSQQIKGPSGNGSFTPLETSSYIKNAMYAVNQQKQQADAEDAQSMKINEYYQKKGEEELQKQSKLNAITIENAFKKDMEQVNAKYTDLTDPEQRQAYQEELKKLYTERNTILQDKTDPTLAYKMTAETNKAIKQQFTQKVKESAFNTLTQVYIQGAKTDPVDAWEQTDKTYKQLMSTAKTPEEKIAMMDAWMELKKTTSADETFDTIKHNEHINKETDAKVTGALGYFKKQGIKLDSVYTDPTQAKHAKQLIHDYAMKQGWDATTEARALSYIKYQKPNKSTSDSSKYTGKPQDFLDDKIIEINRENPDLKMTSVPVKIHDKVINKPALDTKYAADLLAGSLPAVKQYGLDKYADKGVKPLDYATQVLKLDPTTAKKLDEAISKGKNIDGINYRTYQTYAAYKDYYDLASGKNKVFVIPATDFVTKNNDNSDNNIYIGDNLAIPKDKIRKIDVNGVPTYYVTSKDIQKYSNGKDITLNNKVIANGTVTWKSKTAIPKYDIVKPENEQGATELGLFHTFLGSATYGKDNKQATNAYMMTHPDKFLNTKNRLFKTYYKAYKAKNPDMTEKDYFEKIYKPSYLNAVQYANPYYNAQRMSKDMPGLTVIPPKSDISKMRQSDYAFKLQPKEILKDPKQSIKFLRILDLTASKSGRPIKNIKTLYKLAKDKPGEFREKFYDLLNNNVDGCKNVGNGISECKMRYEGIFNLIKALRNTK